MEKEKEDSKMKQFTMSKSFWNTLPQKIAPRILCLFAGYLLGSFLTAEFTAKIIAGKSARQIGSGNPGMTNIMTNLGKKAGFTVLLGDIAKTILALILSWKATGKKIGKASLLWGGLGTIFGHNFSFLSCFKGGKGVVVTCTWLIICMPLWGTLSCLAGGLVCLLSGFLPLGAVLIAPLSVLPGFLTLGKEAGWAFLLSSVMMFSRHRRGLCRIKKGTETKFFRHFSKFFS